MRGEKNRECQRRDNYVRENGVDEGLFFDLFLFVCVICLWHGPCKNLRGGLGGEVEVLFGGFSRSINIGGCYSALPPPSSHQLILPEQTLAGNLQASIQPEKESTQHQAIALHPCTSLLLPPGIYLCCPPTPGWLIN